MERASWYPPGLFGGCVGTSYSLWPLALWGAPLTCTDSALSPGGEKGNGRQWEGAAGEGGNAQPRRPCAISGDTGYSGSKQRLGSWERKAAQGSCWPTRSRWGNPYLWSHDERSGGFPGNSSKSHPPCVRDKDVLNLSLPAPTPGSRVYGFKKSSHRGQRPPATQRLLISGQQGQQGLAITT